MEKKDFLLFLLSLVTGSFLLSSQPLKAQYGMEEGGGSSFNEEEDPFAYLNEPPPEDVDSSSPSSSNLSKGSSSSGGSPKGGGSQGPQVLTDSKRKKLTQASADEINDKNFPELIDSFDYPDVNIADVVKAISELTGKNFILEPGVSGKITILAPSQITVAEAYRAFLSALAINGYTVVPSGNFLKIRKSDNAKRDGLETYAGAYYPNTDQMITRIITLKHISAEAVKTGLSGLLPGGGGGGGGSFTIYAPTNSLIISDYGSNIDRLMKILSHLDVPGFEDELEVIPVRYAKAKDIGELVNKIVNKGDTNSRGGGGMGGGFASGVPNFPRGGGGPSTGNSHGQGSPYFMVIPDERSNSLITLGNKAGIARVKTLLKQLDFQIKPEESGGVYVYYVKYGEAEKIAQTLDVIAKESGPKSGGGSSGGGSPLMISPTAGVQVGSQSIFGGNIKLSPDKNTNSLVIIASKQDYEVILSLLSKIDIPRDQVYVETIIMEMKAVNNLDWQIGYFQYEESGSGGKAGFNGMSQGTLESLLSPSRGSGAILGFGSKNIIQLRPPGGGPAIPMPSLVGFITFLKTHSNANILSTPQLLAMDNQEAEIEVGDQVITRQNVIMNPMGGSQSQPHMEPATIHLKIKPFISLATNSVRLDLTTKVAQLSTAKTPPGLADFTQPLATRLIKTNIVVPNKDTAVLGGLMKEDDVEQVRKVPLLGDIPVLGWLFKSRSTSKEKTNMLIFLTPSIIRLEGDSRRVLNKKLNQRLDFIKSNGGRDPYGKAIDEISKTASAVSEEGLQDSLEESQKNNEDSLEEKKESNKSDREPSELSSSEVDSSHGDSSSVESPDLESTEFDEGSP
jgi:general secretion pathway protein D